MSAPVLPKDDPLIDVVGSVARTQDRQESGTPQSFALLGPRSDLPSGYGVRVRIGLLSDGSYGVERYSSSGVRSIPTWI